MTANQRIAINFLATYGRSLFALACGLFSGRWMLMSLGEVDYGLYGVVGGLAGFVSFFNSLMSGAVSRYYAFHVGAAADLGTEGVETCRKWFTTALVVHVVVPIVLMTVGYPLGIWSLKNFLAIPLERIDACIWVWRFVCVNCFVGMVSVPFIAMYTAKQEIAEMTLYGFFQTTFNVCVLYYMVSHEGRWLVPYAAWACFISIVPQILMCVRAALSFPECRFRKIYIFGWDRLKDLVTFASLRFAGALTIVLQSQGMVILTNRFLGPARNAAMTVGNSLAAHSESLSGALDTALGPAITTACGAGDYVRMRSLCYRACKFEAALMLVFVLPLSLEMDEVMSLWLGAPPALAAPLCTCLLVCLVLEKICSGHWMAIFAFGRIGWYQIALGFCGILVFVLAWGLVENGFDLVGVGYALVFGKVIASGVRLWFGQTVGGLLVRRWLVHVLVPLAVTSVLAWAAGCAVVVLKSRSLERAVLTTFVVECIFLPLCWMVVLTQEERSSLLSHVKAKIIR